MHSIANYAAGAVVLSLTSIAGYLVPAIPGTEAIFNVTAVGSGLAGYWLGRTIGADLKSIRSRIIIVAFSIVAMPLLAYKYILFVNSVLIESWDDIFGFLSFSFLFGFVGMFLGLNQIELLGRSEGSDGAGD